MALTIRDAKADAQRKLREVLTALDKGKSPEPADISRCTEIEAPIPYRQNKHVLFGQQEGLCNGCWADFPLRLFEVDHCVPRSRGGTDHLENLQLLSSSCNRIKATESAAVPGGKVGGD